MESVQNSSYVWDYQFYIGAGVVPFMSPRQDETSQYGKISQ